MRLILICIIALRVSRAFADTDPIGLVALQRCEPGLTGCGVPVAQVEVSSPGWQANPAAIGHCLAPMAWTCSTGSVTNFPNALGSESGHANEVARHFFGIAPAVGQMENYEVGYFANNIIPNQLPIAAKIVNQSFTYFARNMGVDQRYDNYAARYNVLFVSGAGNDGWVRSPSTAYNSISVGAYGGTSSIGPATDGRSKPDITAPASVTSYSTPQVAGAAALLMQAGATDIRLLKALLLNGAQKPAGWTNSPTCPLDQRYGAGMLNVYNALANFRSGQYSVASVIHARRGWDIGTIGSNEVRQYTIEIRGSNITATLIWLRNYGCANISDLNLLLRSETGELIAGSTSTLDNVEHLHVSNLTPGRYILEVVSVNGAETYGFAFDCGPGSPPRLKPWALMGEPAQRYLIESSLDLRTWTPWMTNRTSNAGTFDFSPGDTGAKRFFRAIELP